MNCDDIDNIILSMNSTYIDTEISDMIEYINTINMLIIINLIRKKY